MKYIIKIYFKLTRLIKKYIANYNLKRDKQSAATLERPTRYLKVTENSWIPKAHLINFGADSVKYNGL